MPRILLVEDEERWQNDWMDYAKAFNVEMVCEATLGNALRRLKDEPFDAVITDMMYPAYTGDRSTGPSGAILVAELLLREPPIPFLLYSGSPVEEVSTFLARYDVRIADVPFVRKDRHFNMKESLLAVLARIG